MIGFVSETCSQVLGKYLIKLKPSHGKKGGDREEERQIKKRMRKRVREADQLIDAGVERQGE